MKRSILIVVLTLCCMCSITNADYYLLSDNYLGSTGPWAVSSGASKLDRTIGWATYRYSTALGGTDAFTVSGSAVDPLIKADSPDYPGNSTHFQKLQDGLGASGQFSVNLVANRIDVVYDLGARFNITRADLRYTGAYSGGFPPTMTAGVSAFTVRVSDTNDITAGTWQTLGAITNPRYSNQTNFVNGNLNGRYVWFEIHADPPIQSLFVDELFIFGGSILPDNDHTAPTPNPSTWAVEPMTLGAHSITMTATTASDASGVEYWFEETSGSGIYSGWQKSPTYICQQLSPETSYTFRCKTRDRSANQNETSYSTLKSATTTKVGYLLSDNVQYDANGRPLTVEDDGALYPASDYTKLPSANYRTVTYWYDTSLGSANFFTLFPPPNESDRVDDSNGNGSCLHKRKLQNGVGVDGPSCVQGDWGQWLRADAVFDLGSVYKITGTDLRTSGQWNPTSSIWNAGVSTYTVRVNAITRNIASPGWQLLGTVPAVEHYQLNNFIDGNSVGRYVWFEIHGDYFQLFIDEVAILGDRPAVIPADCNSVWANSYGLQADINKDCYVSFKDVAKMAQDWNSVCGSPGDVNNDCHIDIKDLQIFVNSWLTCNNPRDPSCQRNW